MDQVQQPADWGGYQSSPLNEKEPASRYILGFVGALLGAVVGCIPWFIVSTFMNYFVGLLGFVVGIASFFGYKLLKGPKKTVYAYAVVLACSIVCILVSGAVGYYVSVVHATIEDLGITMSEFSATLEMLGYTHISFYMEMLQEPDVMPEFLLNIGIGLVLGILGIVSVRRHIAAYALPGQGVSGAQGVPVQTGFDPNAAGGVPVQTSPVSFAPAQADIPPQTVSAVQTVQTEAESTVVPVPEPVQQELPH